MKKIFHFITGHKIIAGILFLSIAGSGYFFYTRNGKSSETDEVETAKVEIRNIEKIVSGTGQIQPKKEATLSSPLSAEVKALYVKEGQAVKKDELIAEIDTSDLYPNLAKAKTNLEMEQIQFQKLKEPFDRYDILKAENELTAAKDALTQLKLSQAQEYDKAKDDKDNAKDKMDNLDEDDEKYDTYKQQYEDAKRTLESIKLNHPIELAHAEKLILEKEENLKKLKAGTESEDLRLQELSIDQQKNSLNEIYQDYADAKIKAAFDGVITEVFVDEGDILSSSGSSSTGNAIATLATKEMEAVVLINEVDMPEVTLGKKVRLTIDALSDKMIEGEVTDIVAKGVTEQNVVNYEVAISFQDQDEKIKQGMSASADILIESVENVMSVPTSAIHEGQNGKNFVMVLNKGVDPNDLQASSLQQKRDGNSEQKDRPFTRIEVTTGASDDTYTEIISDEIKPQDIVIVNMKNGNQNSSSTNSEQRNGSIIPTPGSGRGMRPHMD